MAPAETIDTDLPQAALVLQAAIHDQILQFPDGYGTLVGERGLKLRCATQSAGPLCLPSSVGQVLGGRVQPLVVLLPCCMPGARHCSGGVARAAQGTLPTSAGWSLGACSPSPPQRTADSGHALCPFTTLFAASSALHAN